MDCRVKPGNDGFFAYDGLGRVSERRLTKTSLPGSTRQSIIEQ